MHSYRERLRAPVSWWITGMFTMFIFGSIVWFGFALWIAWVTYAVLFAVTGAFLHNWGRAKIEISGGELWAGGARLPLAATGEVRELNEAAGQRAARTESRPAGLPADPAVPPPGRLHRGHGARLGRAVLAAVHPASRRARRRHPRIKAR